MGSVDVRQFRQSGKCQATSHYRTKPRLEQGFHVRQSGNPSNRNKTRTVQGFYARQPATPTGYVVFAGQPPREEACRTAHALPFPSMWLIHSVERKAGNAASSVHGFLRGSERRRYGSSQALAALPMECRHEGLVIQQKRAVLRLPKAFNPQKPEDGSPHSTGI